MIVYLWLILFVALLLLGWLLTLLTLPGNWLMLLAAIGYVLLVDGGSRWALPWWSVWATLLLALLGELLEFAAGALGTSRSGGSRRSALLAIVGALVGAIVGALVGLPVPLIGSAIASLLGASLGAMVGAIVGEASGGQPWTQSLRVGEGAFWGRLAGSLAKVATGTGIAALLLMTLLVGAITH